MALIPFSDWDFWLVVCLCPSFSIFRFLTRIRSASSAPPEFDRLASAAYLFIRSSPALVQVFLVLSGGPLDLVSKFLFLNPPVLYTPILPLTRIDKWSLRFG